MNTTLFHPIAALLQPTRFKIRFPNKKAAVKGFGILFYNNGDIEAFGDYTFGLNSEERLKLLDQQGVPYERVN